jgi:DNA-binding IclR family transcriptional regulator
MPATSTSTGKAMLAELSTEELHALYPAQELERLTPNSLRTRDELEAQLAVVRERGYALSSEESERGVSSIAVAFPLRGTPGRIAFNVSLPTSRMAEADQHAIGDALRAVVAEAARHLHG